LATWVEATLNSAEIELQPYKLSSYPWQEASVMQPGKQAGWFADKQVYT